jgi:lipopolysaccharide transport system ATP-binding protein
LPMCSDSIVRVHNVSKCYQGYAKPSHRLWQSILGTRKKLYQEFWALQDVSLDLKRGETVGIVGKNGSGKSTLLQIIAGTLQSTSGEVESEGRISALLELGAGFNPEFTGMENARLNASILGLTREQFLERLPDIVEFSGLGDFMLRPVKTYSSGMYVRLAFSVAIHMNPDILIIDEALAVGDIRFQRKCFRRLEELKNSGVAILFVTHSADSIVNYCDRAVLLDDGRVLSIGEPKDVVHDYLELMFSSDTEPVLSERGMAHADKTGTILNLDPAVDACTSRPTYNASEHRWGDRRAEIIDYRLTAGDEEIRHSCDRGARITLRVAVHFNVDVDRIIYGLTVKSADGMVIYGTNSRLKDVVDSSQQAGDLVQLEFALKVNLLGGDYFISIGVAQDDEDKDNVAIDRRYDMIHLRVEDNNDAFGFASLDADLKRLVEEESRDS